MRPSTAFGSAGDWFTLVLYALLTVVVLLAPLAPFAGFVFVARCRPAWWAAFWHNPVINGVLLAFALASARVVFLQILYLLAHVLSAAVYPMTYAWIPEMLARITLADLGWNVTPTPTESRFRFSAIAFAINLAFWLALLLLITTLSTFWRWCKAKP